MPSPSPELRILVATRDLFFRAKLEGLARAAGVTTARGEPADVVVLELSGDEDLGQVRDLVARGVPVIAFASHVRAQLLRAAREAGAVAVPNSQVEAALREWIAPRA